MQKYSGILSRCKLFDGIAEKDLLRMLECLGAKVVSFDKKNTVFFEGTPARDIGILLSGSAQIIQFDYNGNRSILSYIGPSDSFAEAFACSETRALPVSIVANEPSVIMLIDCGHVLHTCSNNCGFHQQLIFNLMKELATKNVLFHQKLEILSKRSTREKLLAYLTLQAKRADSNRFDISFNRQELADYLEVDRSGLSAEISKLKKEGIIANKKNSFELL